MVFLFHFSTIYQAYNVIVSRKSVFPFKTYQFVTFLKTKFVFLLYPVLTQFYSYIYYFLILQREANFYFRYTRTCAPILEKSISISFFSSHIFYIKTYKYQIHLLVNLTIPCSMLVSKV